MIAAVLLVVGISGVPLVADWCAASCESAHAQGVPSCHRANPAMAHIGQVPPPCGHDHRPIVVDAATTSTNPRSVSLAPATMIVSTAATWHAVTLHYYAAPIEGQFSPPLSLSLSSVLRI